jgi:hypothetical protein
VLGVDHTDEGHAVDLVGDVLAGRPGHGALELAGEVGVLGIAHVAPDDLLDRRGAVDDLVGGDPGHRGTEDHAWGVPAGLGGRQSHGLEQSPDLRHVLDADPVQLDVLTVGDVGGVPPEARRDLGHCA